MQYGVRHLRLFLQEWPHRQRYTQRKPLFTRRRGALVDYADGIVGSRAEAEDLVQEAWLRLEKAGRRGRLDQPLAYVYRIVRNLAFDVRRRMTHERKVMSDADFDVAAAIQRRVERWGGLHGREA